MGHKSHLIGVDGLKLLLEVLKKFEFHKRDCGFLELKIADSHRVCTCLKLWNRQAWRNC